MSMLSMHTDMPLQKRPFIPLFFLMIISVSGAVNALSFDKLMMPGKLIDGHSRYEKKCETCHKKLKKERQDELCLDCHDHRNIAVDIEERRGFHGKSVIVSRVACSHCHTDHEGRNADVILFDSQSFDHTITDFKLNGKHQNVECSECHFPDRKYNEAPVECIDCHKDDQPHDDRLGKECDKCHTNESWSKLAFNHDKDTDFVLKEKHSELACNLCHAEKRYKETPKTCIACHHVNDSHQGKNGNKCEDCHRSDDWKRVRFDHDKETKFSLTGMHKKRACYSCHKKKIYSNKKLQQECFSCHRLSDEHKGVNGEKCSQCHTTKGWSKTKFTHDTDTKFTLKGKHKGLACRSCHRDKSTDKKQDMSCISCHKDDDLHRNQEGNKCEYCHTEKSWNQDVFFEHDLTNFPLVGQHGTVPCESCHLSPAFKDVEKSCNECHQPEDPHGARLGDRCEQCHNPTSWNLWEFDHDTRTDYPLNGSHRELVCHACHEGDVNENSKPSKRCIACHRKDDSHRGRFGRFCGRCHTQERFSEITIGQGRVR
ncbi:MAG: cytochrome c3 family protein [Sedimenticola sp.]